MNIYLLVILFSLAFISCNDRSKDVDHRFQKDFYEKIDQMGAYSPRQAIDDQFIITSSYLYMLTGRSPLCEIKTYSCFLNSPDSVIYTKEDYMKDRSFWLDWYDKHKEEVKFEFADSIYQVIRKKALKDSQSVQSDISDKVNNTTPDTPCNLLPGAYGIDELGNAYFAFDLDSIYYPDANLRYQYILKGDTIQVFQEEDYILKLVIKELSKDRLLTYNINYQTTDTLIRRDAETGNEMESSDQLKFHFKQFLTKFSEDTLFQIRHIQFPFETHLFSFDETVETTLIISNDWKHLDFSQDSKFVARDVDAYEQIIEVSSDSTILSLKGIDNGISIDYIFERKNEEWILTKLLDYSN